MSRSLLLFITLHSLLDAKELLIREAEKAPFFFPGIVQMREGEREGTDHLLKLGETIGVHVDFDAEGPQNLPITPKEIEERIAEQFKKARLIPTISATAPLPIFHFLIMALPLPKGYSLLITGRLFEKVELRGLTLPKEATWQAITWEKQILLLAPTDELKEEIQTAIDEITEQFTERVQFYRMLEQRPTAMQAADVTFLLC